MQTLVIEFARNVCGLERADSTEFDPATPHRVIYKLRELTGVDEMGGTMRLGAYPCLLAEGSFAQRGLRRPADQRAPPPPLRVQPRIRAGPDRTRPAPHGTHAGRRVRGDLRDPGPSLVPGLPVPSRVQVAAARAAPVVHGLHRRRAGAPRGHGRMRRTSRRGRCPMPIELVTPRGETIAFGGGSPLALIAGPCVIESEEHVHFLAREIAPARGSVRLQGVLRQSQPQQRVHPTAVPG